ncbi:MAG: heme o synthase [Bacteroidia bacterium]|nr:protoheme IX farnesyltransferase [Bacteroidia bacterium]MCZ2276568.1 heme o synthase [Bacteroidia bacterium]
MKKAIATVFSNGIISKVYDFGLLIKFKLLMFVVLSAAFAYLLGAEGSIDWIRFFWLSAGGILITASANSLNEIYERHTDALMKRTHNRPLPANRMQLKEALVLSILMGISGFFVLVIKLNFLSAVLGIVALILYAFVYTPMKKVSYFSVHVGAVPGAMPPLIGWIAARGELGIPALVLFLIQFLWQLPHFWALAWMLDDDYSKAGFKLLPSPRGKSKASALHAVIYASCLIPIGLLPYLIGLTGSTSAIILTLSAIIYTWFSIRLYKNCTNTDARNLMYASIIYLPFVMLALVLDKI